MGHYASCDTQFFETQEKFGHDVDMDRHDTKEHAGESIFVLRAGSPHSELAGEIVDADLLTVQKEILEKQLAEVEDAIERKNSTKLVDGVVMPASSFDRSRPPAGLIFTTESGLTLTDSLASPKSAAGSPTSRNFDLNCRSKTTSNNQVIIPENLAHNSNASAVIPAPPASPMRSNNPETSERYHLLTPTNKADARAVAGNQVIRSQPAPTSPSSVDKHSSFFNKQPTMPQILLKPTAKPVTSSDQKLYVEKELGVTTFALLSPRDVLALDGIFGQYDENELEVKRQKEEKKAELLKMKAKNREMANLAATNQVQFKLYRVRDFFSFFFFFGSKKMSCKRSEEQSESLNLQTVWEKAVTGVA